MGAATTSVRLAALDAGGPLEERPVAGPQISHPASPATGRHTNIVWSNGALDPWSSNAFTTYGFIAVGVLLFVFVVVIGPPPDTGGRCSLPWC